MSVLASIKPLAWESAFFGRRCALLELQGDSVLDVARLNDWDLVQVKVMAQQSAELDALSALGFRLVEGEADCALGIAAADRPAGIRIARVEHIAQLRHAAEQAFTFSRFRTPWFAAGDSGRFYAQWIENAVRGTFDHQCLLAVDAAGAMQGFISLRELPDGTGRIGLLAVLPESQGLGIGQRLMNAANDWCLARRLSRLQVATQLGNLPALRLYLRCGGIIERTAYWLYREII